MQNWLTRAYGRWSSAKRNRHEAERLALLPHYLLRDMGLPLDGTAALDRQLRSGSRR